MGRPYGQHYLTEEQKKLAADNINLVWWHIKKLLSDKRIRPPEIDEVAGHLLWHLCLAAEKYDPTKNVKFSSFAIYAFRTGFSRYLGLRSIWEDRFKIMNFEFGGESEDEYGYPYRPIREKRKKYVRWEDMAFLFDKIELTPMEEQVKYYYYQQGLNLREIGEVINYSKERTRLVLKNMIGRIKAFVEENEYIVEDFVSK